MCSTAFVSVCAGAGLCAISTVANAQAQIERLGWPTVARDSSDPYVRYTSPGQCEQAARRLFDQYWRDKRADTIRYTPETDSVPAPVLLATRQCAARFSAATVEPRELLDLAYLYLWTQQDDLARAAMARLERTNANRSTTDRAWPLYLYVKGLLQARPGRLREVRTAMQQLDAVGASAATWRLFAHNLYASYAVMINDLGTAESEARAALTASHQMSFPDRVDWAGDIQTTYFTLTTPVSMTRGGPVALAVLDTAVTDLSPLRPAGSGDQQEIRDGIRRRRTPLAALGKHGLPPVHATTWFGTNGDTTRPRRGVATLLISTPSSCDGGCYPMFATIQRLHATYGDRLDIVLMTATRGFFRDQLILSPTAEADSSGNYYTRFLQLPVALAVESTSFAYAPDGRRQNTQVVNARSYPFDRPAIFLDPSGTVRWVGEVSPYDERLLDGVIRSSVEYLKHAAR